MDTPTTAAAPISNEMNDGVANAINLVLKTWPFVVLRGLILLAFTTVVLIWYAIGAVILSHLGNAQGLGLVFLIIFFLAPVGVFQLMRRYFLYMLKLAHVACLTELILGRPIPEEGMIAYGKEVVTKKFAGANALFVIDALIKGVTNSVLSLVDSILSFIPLPGESSLMNIFNKIIRMATSYIDETMFSYTLSRKEENLWAGAKDGLILYAQNAKPLLMTAVKIVILELVISGIAFGISIVPIMFISDLGHFSGIWFIVLGAALMAYTIRSAFFRPVGMVMIMTTYYKTIQGQVPNPVWQERLLSASSQFQQICDQAKSYLTHTPKAI